MMRRFLVITILAAAALGTVWFVAGPLRAWTSIERVPFDPGSAREVLEAREHEGGLVPIPADPSFHTEMNPNPATESNVPVPNDLPQTVGTPESAVADTSPPTKDDPEVYLILGSDAAPSREQQRADTILLFITPPDHSESLLISIPRLLYVTSPCTGIPSPINTNLDGCQQVSGLDLMGVAVEDYTGLSVDHLVLFGFDAFRTLIDQFGGIDVCVDHAVKLKARQRRNFLESGCNHLNGAKALRWLRTRSALELIDDNWRLMEDAGDLGRTQRQRELVRQLMGRLDMIESRDELRSIARKLSGLIALDEGFSLAEAADMAWDMRDITDRPIHDMVVDTRSMVTAEGEYVLVPTRSFSDYLGQLG